MSEEEYKYEKVNVIKAIVENPDGKILLIKEPETNEWMPGRWGLPGGKPFEKESLYRTFKRKMKGELGLDIEPLGIYKIEELLIQGRTVIVFHAVAHIETGTELKGEVKERNWVGIEEIKKMEVSEFSEFFNKELLLDYLVGGRELIDFDLIETQQYFDMHENIEFKKWKGEG
jgi:ADP-ribose pyrophosphatase YjhB (NUDIX family)